MSSLLSPPGAGARQQGAGRAGAGAERVGSVALGGLPGIRRVMERSRAGHRGVKSYVFHESQDKEIEALAEQRADIENKQ